MSDLLTPHSRGVPWRREPCRYGNVGQDEVSSHDMSPLSVWGERRENRDMGSRVPFGPESEGRTRASACYLRGPADLNSQEKELKKKGFRFTTACPACLDRNRMLLGLMRN